MIFLGYMLRSDSGIYTDTTPDRVLARQIFSLSDAQSHHPHLCFEELKQNCRLWEIVASALVWPRQILRCYLY